MADEDLPVVALALSAAETGTAPVERATGHPARRRAAASARRGGLERLPAPRGRADHERLEAAQSARSGADRHRGASDFLTHGDFLARKHLMGLDGVRGLAALLVVISHSRDWQVGQIFIGKVGVVIFFVLSGLLITTLLLREEERFGRVNIGAFITRRFLRILPLYFITIALFAVAVAATETGERRERFFQALPYMTALVPEIPYSWSHDYAGSVTWSIGIEEKFYLVWPLLVFAVAMSIRNRSVVAVSIAVAAMALAQEFSLEIFFGYTAIALGCAAALVLHAVSGYRRATTVLRRPWVVLACAALWGAAYAFVSVDQLLGLFAVALVSTVLLAALVMRRETPRLLRWKPLVHLGRVSFGVYLLHQLVMAIAERALPQATVLTNVAVIVIVVPTVTLVATASSRWLELPVRRLGHRLPWMLTSSGRSAGAVRAASSTNVNPS